MRGGYDLYGRYYPNIEDAINAEMAQCAAIDADYTRRELDELRQDMQQPHPSPLNDEFMKLWDYVRDLEQRVKQLESGSNSGQKPTDDLPF